MKSAKEIFDAHWPKGHYEYLAIMAGISLAQQDARAEKDEINLRVHRLLNERFVLEQLLRDIVARTGTHLRASVYGDLWPRITDALDKT